MRSRNETHMSAVVKAEVKPTNAYATDVILLRSVSTVTESNWADMAPLSALPVFQKRQRIALRMRSMMKNRIKPPARGIVNSADEYILLFSGMESVFILYQHGKTQTQRYKYN
jgi:hypothetical protein